MSLLDKAIAMATHAHAGQVDKQDVPYIFHPLRSMELVRRVGGDESQQIVAVLHDVIEDTCYTYATLASGFGFSIDDLFRQRFRFDVDDSDLTIPDSVEAMQVLDILDGVKMLTKEEGAPNDPYIADLAKSRWSIVKWADSTDNWARLGGLEPHDRDRLAKRYAKNFEMLGETPRLTSMRITHLLAMKPEA